MQLFEYYRRESDEKIECLEGRWHWKVDMLRHGKDCSCPTNNENKPTNSQQPQKPTKTWSSPKNLLKKLATKFGKKPILEKTEEFEKIVWCFEIKWTDLFGRETDEIAFSIKTPERDAESLFNDPSEWGFAPINRYFGLIFWQAIEQKPPKHLFWGIEFCWGNKTCRIGEMFDLNKYNDTRRWWNVLADTKTHSNPTHLPFLFYAYSDSTHIHCRLNTNSLYIERLGSYELTPENFDCLNLNGLIISGLASETKEIHQFEVDKKEFLKPIDISDGFPTEPLRCIYKKERLMWEDQDGMLRTAAAWSNDGRYLFAWTEVKGNLEQEHTVKEYHEALRSTIYRISLDNGNCFPLSHVFHQKIGRLGFGLDDKLYVCNEEFLGRGRRRPDGTFEVNHICSGGPATRIQHLYRMLIGRPESLLFLTAAKTFSRSSLKLPAMAQKILDKSGGQIPRNIYKEWEPQIVEIV